MKAFFLLFALTTSFAFAHSQAEERRAIDQLYKTAKELSDKNLRCKVATDCSFLEIGDRACGGAQGYVMVSKKNANLPEITFLAQSSVEKEKEFNAKYGIVSICSLTYPGTASCVKNKCAEL